MGIIELPFESGCSDVPASSMLGGLSDARAGVYGERVDAVPEQQGGTRDRNS